MHTLTKILVVFCAVLSLLLAALTIAYAANADQIVAGYNAETAAKIQAISEAQAASTAHIQARDRAAAELAGIARERDELRGQISQLESQAANLRTTAERERAQVAAIQNQITQLSAAATSQMRLIENYREEVTALRNEQLAGSRREIELVDRINDLESQRQVLDQTARALREQIAELQVAVRTAGEGGRARPDQPFQHTGPTIRGNIREVQRTGTGGEVAVIDVGANSGIQPNMQLSIVRGSQFIANLVIERADPRESVGRIDKLGRDVQVRQGDTVMSRLE